MRSTAEAASILCRGSLAGRFFQKLEEVPLRAGVLLRLRILHRLLRLRASPLDPLASQRLAEELEQLLSQCLRPGEISKVLDDVNPE